MQIKSAVYIKSSKEIEDCPKPDMPEYAFIGRSNVGKSSLINMVAGIKNLAKTSGRPGKTQLINHFLVNDDFYFGDLPGYGFAKVPKSIQKDWQQMISNYLMNRRNLMTVFVLVDSRIEPQDIDINFINDLGENNIPITIVFTKSDKLTKNKIASNISQFKKTLLRYWTALPNCIITSSETGEGKEEFIKFIEKTNKSFVKPD